MKHNVNWAYKSRTPSKPYGEYTHPKAILNHAHVDDADTANHTAETKFGSSSMNPVPEGSVMMERGGITTEILGKVAAALELVILYVGCEMQSHVIIDIYTAQTNDDESHTRHPTRDQLLISKTRNHLGGCTDIVLVVKDRDNNGYLLRPQPAPLFASPHPHVAATTLLLPSHHA
jgi:hypothetical protein